MSNDVISIFDNLPAEMRDIFDAEALGDDLVHGATGGGFQVLSIKSSKWRVKSGGEDFLITNEDGDPAASIQVVLIKANRNISKMYYEKSYSDGDAEAPDCYSINGETPEPDSLHKQADNCASCPKNQWGSRITDSGKKAKACADHRRVAVKVMSPLPEGVNDDPMLLRIPATSLQDLAVYGRKMMDKGFPYNAVITRLGFDIDASYPKLTFKAVRPINTAEAKVIAELSRDDLIGRILSESDFDSSAKRPAEEDKPTSTVDTEFEEAPEQEPDEAPKPKKAAPKKKAAAKKAAPKEEEPEQKEDAPAAADSGGLDDIDAIIAELEGK